MVTINRSTIKTQSHLPRFYYITGSDGTGKTTQTDLLLEHLSDLGFEPQRVWLRFAFLLSIPLMVYARFWGYSWHEQKNGISQGYWDFSNSWLLRNLLPWTMLIDAAMVALFRIYIPLWTGRTIVCERFALDMIADLEIALHDTTFHTRLPGRLFFNLVPNDSRVILLDGDPEELQSRRLDLMFDRCLPKRVAAYQRLAHTFSLPMLPSELTIVQVSESIRSYVNAHHSPENMTEQNKVYNKFESGIMQGLASWMPVAIAMHWTMQGILYADPTEKLFRILVDFLLTIVGTLILINWLNLPMALLIAFLIAHTINFLTNSQLCALSRDFGLVNIKPDEFVNHIKGIKERAEQDSSIKSLIVCGGIGREHLHAGSDFDARIIRHPGFFNGLRSAIFLMKERSRALVRWFPLDMYLFDNEQSLSTKLKKGEIMNELNENTLSIYVTSPLSVEHNT